jgi:hypothetical protein
MKLFLLYDLREGVTLERYREWSLTRDQPTLKGREGIREYRVFALENPDGGDDGACTIVEHVDVADWETWKRVTSTGPMVAIGEDFGELVDTGSVITLRGEEIH